MVPSSVDCSVGGVGAGPAQLVPVHPVLSWRQPAEGDEGLAQQQGVLPEGAVAQNPQVDDPLLEVALGDPLVHQLGGGRGGVSTHTSYFRYARRLQVLLGTTASTAPDLLRGGL